MERLTVKRPDGRWAIAGSDNASPTERVMKIPAVIDRLAAYEDTGLEPEQIIRARDTLECFDNIGIKRGNEIVKAEQEGRLVVLPCKVGDTVFFRTYTQNATVDLGVQPHRVIAARCYMIVEGEYANVGLPVDQFGKTVFLNREEAEKALRGGGSNEDR